MTQTEQVFAVANRYLHGSDIGRETILSCFTDEEKKTFVISSDITNCSVTRSISMQSNLQYAANC